ncbi:MAG: TonB-dependent receptor [Acidobacteria bacterium]|nr:TonB-dependent receptor [Acidobacteriota bacterium]
MFQKTCSSLLFFLVFFPLMSMAQVTTGTISGVVRDRTQAVLPGASVTIRQVETGLTRKIVTDDQGRYRVPQFPVGNYEVQAELTGFGTEIRQGITLTVGREAVVDFTLSVGEVTEKVVVSGEAPLVETTTSQMGALVDDKKIRDLPLNGRSFEQLALLQPGVVIYTQADRSLQFGSGVKFSVSGSRAHSNLFLLDGTDINDQADFTPGSAAGVVLGVETLREFSVLTNTYSAEYGRKTGGIVNAVTRSGTNELHGNAFYFHRNDNLDARNFFNPGTLPKPEFKRNQFGATAGGPLRRDRTFFFGGYEGLRERLGLSNVTVVPNADAHQGCLPNVGQPGLRCVGVDSRVKPYLDLFPLPNGRDFGDGTADFFSSPTKPTREDNFSVRVDHQFSDTDSFFTRYTFDDANVFIPEKIPTFGTGLKSRYQYLTLEEKRIFSPTVLNVFRFGFNRSFSDTGAAQTVGPTPNLAFVPGQELIGNINIDTIRAVPYAGGLGSPVSLPRTFAYNLFEYSDDVNYTRAGHSLKVGFNIKRIQLNVVTLARDQRGSFTFPTVEAFLRAQPSVFQSEAPGSDTQRAWRQTVFGFYVQSDIRAIPDLTLNLGLRYEFVTIPEEIHGKSSNLLNVSDPQIAIGPLWPRNPSLRDLAPRIGFAYDPSSNGKTSVRGGFGLFYDLPVSYFYSISGSRTYPFHYFGTVANPPFPNALAGIFRPGAVQLQTFSETLSTPAKIHYNLVIQREVAPQTVVTVGYVGAGSYHLLRHDEANHRVGTILSNGRTFLPSTSARLNPNFGENRRIQTDVNSSYHSLQFAFNRRFSNRLQFQTSYTLSKSTDSGSGGFNVDVQGNDETYVEDPYNLKGDHGLSGFDVRHVLNFNYTYELPALRGWTGAAAKMLEGWRLNGITTVASGVPFSVTTSFANQFYPGANSRGRPSLKAGAGNNPARGGPDRYFDPSGFTLPEPGFPGNLGRDTVTGPGLVNFDFSLGKTTNIDEKRSVQFRAEFFNIFNHPNFSTPLRAVLDARGNLIGSAGRIQSTTTRERQIQFGLKFTF